ncbi:GTPase HflX [Oceanirhabdus sp. W0125-5]|uniref:GTPase HflX n=1 Tax=Oceanirhabdus sp. W0125-5 TaxID=2999116 RepID=UPI0022F2CD4C|nr:GTPase HflX [Oceanirhabdus sp. W0125-5]WBW99473.1 GTPase HflX [Oceanirhabdus sp. W0125-5]
MIYGNIDGVKKSIINQLEEIYELQIEKDILFSEELAIVMNKLTLELNREISVAINRRGKITAVSLGDSTTVELPEVEISERKLSGIRIIHTHPNGNSKLSALDISALTKLKLDTMVAIAVNEEINMIKVNVGYCTIEDNRIICEEYKNIPLEGALKHNPLPNILEINKMFEEFSMEEDKTERAILVGVESEESLKELEELAKACNIKVLDSVLQKRNKIDSAFYIGKGKVTEIDYLRQAMKADVVIFDDELSGSHVRNLEDNIGCKVIDRTTLILDIFARRAKTKEAQLQVELAMLKYRMPRLMGLGTVLSRTGAGIGTRGPGEKKLETDRRHIRSRIDDIRKELERIRKNRRVQREKRGKTSLPTVALVGYTNAGKSTLRNMLCDYVPANTVTKEKVFEANMLFATLETTVRALVLPDNRKVVMSDTVGFVRKLPHDLVEAFKSTLEETIEADVLLHVVDSSSQEALQQIEAVENVLNELGVEDKKILLVLNKIDMATEEQIENIKREKEGYNIIEISALSKINIDELLDAIGRDIPVKLRLCEFLIPYSEGALVSMVHSRGNVIEEEYKGEGTYIKAEVDDELFNRCSEYEIK